MDWGRTLSFLGLAFGISRTVAARIFFSGMTLSGVRGALLLTAGYMGAPSVSAIVIQKLDGP